MDTFELAPAMALDLWWVRYGVNGKDFHYGALDIPDHVEDPLERAIARLAGKAVHGKSYMRGNGKYAGQLLYPTPPYTMGIRFRAPAEMTVFLFLTEEDDGNC